MNFIDKIGSVITSELAVKTTATPCASAGCLGGTQRSGSRHTVEVYNWGTDVVFYGGSKVTTSTGLPIKAGEVKSFPVNNSSAIYLVAGSATSVIIAEYAE